MSLAIAGAFDFNWERKTMSKLSGLTRRDLMISGAAAGLAAATMPLLSRAALAVGTVNFADIGVGDPGGDWSRYTAMSNGWNVNLVAIGNAPSAILNTLVAGGGTSSYDVINIVGGMQKPLVDNDLIEVIDTSQLPNWAKDKNIEEFLGKGTPGFNFIGYQDKVYGVPTVLQGDSFAYLPEKTGPLDSYAALFDPKWKGYVALEDNYTTPGQKKALYLKRAKLANIGNPQDRRRLPHRTEKGRPVPSHLVVVPAGRRPDCEQGSLRNRLLGADGVRGEEQGRRRGLCRSQGRLPSLGDGGLPDQESQSQRRADKGRLPAS
jgi:hypothetical protein